MKDYNNANADLNNLKNDASSMKSWKAVSRSEINAYFAIMGITKCSSYHFNWSKDPIFRIAGIADVMSRDEMASQTHSEDSLKKLRMMISNACENTDIQVAYCPSMNR